MLSDKKSTLLMVLFWGCATVGHSLSIIDFETLPNGGVPVDDTPLPIDFPYVLDNGASVTFGFRLTEGSSAKSPAYFEEIGVNGDNGFSSFPDGIADQPSPAFADQLGQFFLRPPGDFNDVVRPIALDLDFTVPDGKRVGSVSGEIWDIDGGANVEQWRVVAISRDNFVLGSILSPLGIDPSVNPSASLNNLPWEFTIESNQDIARVVIGYVGTRVGGIGVGFNNFSANVVPEPTALAIAAVLAGSLIARRRVMGNAPR